MGSQQQVLGGSRQVVHPEVACLSLERLGHVATGYDSTARLVLATRIRHLFADLFEQFFVGDHHELPRLLIQCTRSSHSGTQELFDLLVGQFLAGELAHRHTRLDSLQHHLCLLHLCRLFTVVLLRFIAAGHHRCHCHQADP